MLKSLFTVSLLASSLTICNAETQTVGNSQLKSAELKRELVKQLKASYSRELVADSLNVSEIKKMKTPKLTPQSLTIGKFKMPYVLLERGNEDDGKKSLFLALHGGGGNPNAKGPHSWRVNSSEWNAQISFTIGGTYAPNGIYFIPRMADDRLGRWQHDHNQLAFEKVIREAILFHGVDPNKVYMIGISEGGYAAFRYGANRSDWFAGTGSMAAAEPFNTSPPENFRNLAFRNDIGENDTMFNRINMSRAFDKKLTELGEKDPGKYVHFFNPQKGRGHGIKYNDCPTWIAKHSRNPSPSKVVWTAQKMHKTLKGQNYWLAIDKAPEKGALYIVAETKNNVIDLSVKQKNKDGKLVAATGCKLRVYLDEKLIDFTKPVKLLCNGKHLKTVTPKQSVEVMKKSLAERGDVNYCYPADISLEL